MPSISSREAICLIQSHEDRIYLGIKWLEQMFACFIDSGYFGYSLETWDILFSQYLAYSVEQSRRDTRVLLVAQLENVRVNRESRTPPLDDYERLLSSCEETYRVLSDVHALWQQVELLFLLYRHRISLTLHTIMKRELPNIEKAITFFQTTHETTIARLCIWRNSFEYMITENGLLQCLEHLDNDTSQATAFAELVTPAFEDLQDLRKNRLRVQSECEALKAEIVKEWLSTVTGMIPVDAVRREEAKFNTYLAEVLSQQLAQDDAFNKIANATKLAIDIQSVIHGNARTVIPMLDPKIVSEECGNIREFADEGLQIGRGVQVILKEFLTSLQRVSPPETDNSTMRGRPSS